MGENENLIWKRCSQFLNDDLPIILSHYPTLGPAQRMP